MKFSTAVLALLVAPVVSFSYLDQLSKPAAPAASNAVADPPFFFTNGVKDEPATPEMNSSPPKPTSGSYLDNLNASPAASSAPSGGNAMGSYLDNLGSQSVAASSAPSGGGMSGYLDALPKAQPPSGAGISNYAESLNQAAASTFSSASSSTSYTAPPSQPAQPQAPAASFTPSGSSAPANSAPTSAGYLSALGGGSAVPSGAGIRGYLDGLPKAAPTMGGGGIRSYLDGLPKAPPTQGGAGIPSYTSSLSGGSASAPASNYAVSGTSDFTIGSITGRFDFSFEADANIVAKMQSAGDRKMTLSGKVKSVEYN